MSRKEAPSSDDEAVITTTIVGEALLGMEAVISVTGLSSPNIYRRIVDAGDDFPRPIKVDGRTLWVASEIRDWIKRRIAQHRAIRSEAA